MSKHEPLPCDESGIWLPLVEYSLKSGLSLSTIRRKIKSNALPHRLERGKYLILFREGDAPEASRAPMPRVIAGSNEESDTPRADNAVRMVSDAFEHALREKDERIHLLERANQALEQQLSELRLLVKVIEEKYEVRY